MKRLFAALVLAVCSQASMAALVNVPLPAGSYISNYAGSGLDVAWAAPCRPIDPSCGVIDLSFQSQFGWRLASAAEAAFLAANLKGQDFVFAGANVPLGGSDANGANFQAGSPGGAAACAAPYFSNFHYHCDWGNAPGANAGYQEGWAFGQEGELSFGEAIVVRNNLVPEAGTLAMLGLGVLLVGAVRRRRQA